MYLSDRQRGAAPVRRDARRLAQRRGISLGFGGGVMIMTSIPVVNFFAMPVAVAGATLLWVEQFQTNPASNAASHQ